MTPERICSLYGTIIETLVLIGVWIKIIEPRHDKTENLTYAPNIVSDQLGYPPGLIRVFADYSKISKDLWLFHADSEHSDQTGKCFWFCHAFAHFIAHTLYFGTNPLNLKSVVLFKQ